jgi:hypothetical protein
METPNVKDRTPVSIADSETTLPMMTLAQWQEHSDKNGIGFGSGGWETSSDKDPIPEREKAVQDKLKVQQK